jgi:endoglycosylceramidase
MRALFLAATALLPFLACSKSNPSPPAAPADAGPTGAPRTDPAAVHVEGTTFRDGQGRQLLFRGYNAKATTTFDVTFDDGRTANETFDDFDDAAAARIEQLGFDVIRFPVSWSGLEPKAQQYSEAFLDKVRAVLALARAHHFYVLIDMHQDSYSKEIGEDGAPLWAIVPAPAQLLSGPSDDSRRLSDQVLSAGFSFFDDVPATDGRPLQDAFTAAVAQMARRFLGDPTVLGYEAFNEPVVLQLDELVAFHEKLADVVHGIDRDAPLLFEPQGSRNQADSAHIPDTPWSHGPGAYAPHIYTGWFSRPDQNGWASEDPSVLAASMAHADLERAGWGTPMFVTEFGCDVSNAHGLKWISAELDLQDQWLASSTAWEFSGRGSWGFYASGSTENAGIAKTMARPYPRAVAGDLVAIERPAPGHMLVRWRATDRTKGLPHEVGMSADYATGYRVLCDGVDMPFTAAAGRATFTCPEGSGDRTFEVIGTPVP